MTFDPKRRLVMASFKTVLGHDLPAGHPLVIVDEPKAAGEVDEALARRLHAGKIAGYQDELHATPVETPEQERNRLALEALRESRRGRAMVSAPADVATDDLLVHQDGPKAGKKVTKDDLLDIAGREGVAVETDDNKPDLIRKIMEHRAQAAVVNGTNAETDGAGGQGDLSTPGAMTPAPSGDAETGAGDAHGDAGE